MSISGSFNIVYPMTLVPQQSATSCWQSALTMLFGGTMTASPGLAELSRTGGLEPKVENVSTLAAHLNLRHFLPQTWTVEELYELIQRGPFVLLGQMPRAHGIVVAGMMGDGTPDGTLLKIYDPFPIGVGHVDDFSYQLLISTFPLFAEHVLQRN